MAILCGLEFGGVEKRTMDAGGEYQRKVVRRRLAAIFEREEKP